MVPSGGTASGVHPVPLGFGRVYVQIEGDFGYEKWIEGLAAGRSFVTTGPIVTAEVRRAGDDSATVSGHYEALDPPEAIEVVVNGKVAKRFTPPGETMPRGGVRAGFSAPVPIEATSWIAVRAFEKRPDGRPRFAHTAPVWIEVPAKPLRPDRADVAYLVQRVEDELRRHEGVLPEEALREYRDAATAFRARLSQ
jgi:hypothetical protein